MRNESFALRLLLLVLFVSAMGSAAAAQYERRALERAREVRMLADDREAVRRVFHEFVLDESDEVMDDFSFGGTKVAVSYASGKCNEDIEEIWDAPQGRVTKIEIEFDGDVEATLFQAELSRLNKERAYTDSDGIYIHHDKKLGLAFRVNVGTVETITVFPSTSGKTETCGYAAAREFVSEKSWFGKRKLEDRKAITECYRADVTSAELSRERVGALTSKQVNFDTSVSNPNNEVLTYKYIVSAGRIIGSGAKVTWDLTGVVPGTYTITAGVDDGCGFCGKTVTKSVVVE